MTERPQAEYEKIIRELAPLGAASSKMFGVPCIKHNGKAFAAFHGDAMVFKLPSPQREEALALDGSHLFDPSGAGRPMKEWVEVTAAHSGRWLGLAREALHYLQALRLGT